jgi:hypothetical protein
VLLAALHAVADRIAQELGTRHTYCQRLTLTIADPDGGMQSRSETLKRPEAEADALYRVGGRLSTRFAISTPVSRLVLTAGRLGPGSSVQHSLFDPAGGNLMPFEDERAVAAAVSLLATRYGAAAVQSAATLYRPTQTSCCTYPLGAITDHEATVQADHAGRPLSFMVGRQIRQITAVQDRWREDCWLGLRAGSRVVYRVTTAECGLFELENQDALWRVRAIAD